MSMRAFTLIETLMYLALLSVLMSGSLVSAYAIAESAERNRAAAWLEQEGLFLLRSVHWDIQGAVVLNLHPNVLDSVLVLRTIDGDTVTFESKEGLLIRTTDHGSEVLSHYLLDNFSVIRTGIRGNPLDPERIILSITSTTLSKGMRLERTFSDIVYGDAP